MLSLDSRLVPLLRGALLWPLLMVLETIHGILRLTFVVPLVGDFRARQLAVFSGAVIVLAFAYVVAPWIPVRGTRALLLLGATWVGLTIPFEIAVGRLSGASWARVWSDFDLGSGGLLPLGLALMLVAPLLAARMRRGAFGIGADP